MAAITKGESTRWSPAEPAAPRCRGVWKHLPVRSRRVRFGGLEAHCLLTNVFRKVIVHCGDGRHLENPGLRYSHARSAAAVQLRRRLSGAGLKAFFDHYALPGGKLWQLELEATLGTCCSLVVVLGPAGIGGWQHGAIQPGLNPRPRFREIRNPCPRVGRIQCGEH